MSRTPLLLAGAAGLFVLEASLLGSLQWYDAYWGDAAFAFCGCGYGQLMLALTHAAPWVGAAAVALASLQAFRRGRGREALFWVVVLGIGLLFGEALKQVFERDRPGIPPWIHSARSFPSGHVFNAALCMGVALHLLGVEDREDGPPRWLRLGLVSAAIVFVAGTAFTRVYLGKHWPSDVIGSMLLATAVLGIAGMCRRLSESSRVAVAGGALTLVVGLYLLAAADIRIHLPSPSTLAADHQDHAVAHLLAMRGRLSLRYSVHQTRPRILKLLAHEAGRGCRHLELRIDGQVVTRQRVRPGWRTYTFALPSQPAGLYRAEVRVVAGPRSRQVTDPQLTVRWMAIV